MLCASCHALLMANPVPVCYPSQSRYVPEHGKPFTGAKPCSGTVSSRVSTQSCRSVVHHKVPCMLERWEGVPLEPACILGSSYLLAAHFTAPAVAYFLGALLVAISKPLSILQGGVAPTALRLALLACTASSNAKVFQPSPNTVHNLSQMSRAKCKIISTFFLAINFAANSSAILSVLS